MVIVESDDSGSEYKPVADPAKNESEAEDSESGVDDDDGAAEEDKVSLSLEQQPRLTLGTGCGKVGPIKVQRQVEHRWQGKRPGEDQEPIQDQEPGEDQE